MARVHLKTPAQGVDLRCDNGHEQKIVLHGYSRAAAIDFARMVDGTSPMYAYPPRQFPVEGSPLARCGICRAWINGRLFGYDEN